MLFKGSNHKRGRHGQAMVEFALAVSVLLFVIFGILEFGRVLFAYSAASDSLRGALRNATILGVEDGGGTRPYLDCADMESRARNNFFTGSQTITIRYQKASNLAQIYSCDGVGATQVTDNDLVNGDLLVIDLDTTVEPIWFRFVDTLNINLKGQRTIIKLIVPGAGAGDEDFDGLLDDWEIEHFGDIESYTASDDPDGDGCNNGCEEDAPTDPKDGADFPAGIGPDPDGDTINTVGIPGDNCPTVANVDQLDADGNGVGDVCEDTDGDGVFDTTDNCINVSNPSPQTDTDGDGMGDACDDDDDGDGFSDLADNCPLHYNLTQDPSVCVDTDGDGFVDADDNCPAIPNPNQDDVCGDDDSDGVVNANDNCVNAANPFQEDDTPPNGIGDHCEDLDGDDEPNATDNCPTVPNPGQEDDNPENGIGDACEADVDTDGEPDYSDNCPNNANPQQEDTDNDGFGDACDDDDDGDTVLDVDDNCPLVPNDQQDNDGDGMGDACDEDADNDTVLDQGSPPDNCPTVPNLEQQDYDQDLIGDACDDDDDNDGVLDAAPDNCQFENNPGQLDNDLDGLGNLCDPDDDNDGINDDAPDNCVFTANTDQADNDGDGEGNVCDATPDPTGTASISGTLQRVPNSNCGFSATFYNGFIVQLTNQDTGTTFQTTTSGSGAFTFSALPAGTFSINPPNTVSAGRVLTAEQDNVSGCFESAISDPVSNVVLSDGSIYTITFGYK